LTTTAEETWRKNLNRKAEGTSKNYGPRFQEFLDWAGLTEDELFKMGLEAKNSGNPLESNEVNELVRDFLVYLKKERKTKASKPLAPGTIRNYFFTILSFFKACSLELQIPDDEVPYAASDSQRAITKERLREAYYELTGEEHRERNRAMIMFAKDTGLRIGDIANLKVRDYLETEDLTGQTFRYQDSGKFVEVQGDGFKRWEKPVLTRKKGRLAYVHIGPETVEALDEYIKMRREMSLEPYTTKSHGVEALQTMGKDLGP